MIAYKLIRKRKDGTYGPLFINQRQRIPIGEWLEAEDHKTKGYAHRPGWHCCLKTEAPHLKQVDTNRVWCEVELDGITIYKRPINQGGAWVLGKRMRVIREL